MTEEKAKQYKHLGTVGEGGLELIISYEKSVISTQFKLKGAVAHSESFTIGETVETSDMFGTKRTVCIHNNTYRT